MVSETKQMEILFTANHEENGQSIGKKNEVIAFFGDSIMERQDVKISPASIDTTIPAFVGKALNAEVHNFAMGGTILTRPTDDQIERLDNADSRNKLRSNRPISMMNLADAIAQKKPNDDSVWGSIKALKEYKATAEVASFDFSKVDTFCIAFGTNDWSWMKETGGCYPLKSSSGEVSFESAAEFIVDRLKGAYPSANIVLFSPIWRGANKTGNTWDSTVFVPVAKGCRMTNLVTTLEDVAMKKHVYFCDNYHLIDFSTIETYYGWLDNADSREDYIHPNENGRRLIADHISAYLKQIFGISSVVTEYFTFHIKGRIGSTELYDYDYQVVKGQLVGSVFTNEVAASLSTCTKDGKTYKNPIYKNIGDKPLTLAELQGQVCRDNTAIWYIDYQNVETVSAKVVKIPTLMLKTMATNPWENYAWGKFRLNVEHFKSIRLGEAALDNSDGTFESPRVPTYYTKDTFPAVVVKGVSGSTTNIIGTGFNKTYDISGYGVIEVEIRIFAKSWTGGTIWLRNVELTSSDQTNALYLPYMHTDTTDYNTNVYTRTNLGITVDAGSYTTLSIGTMNFHRNYPGTTVFGSYPFLKITGVKNGAETVLRNSSDKALTPNDYTDVITENTSAQYDITAYDTVTIEMGINTQEGASMQQLNDISFH